MWANILSIKNVATGTATSKNKSFLTFIMMSISVIIIISLLPSFAAAEYTNTTYKCISCHNDTGFPADSDGDGVAAPYKRPHNNDTMCESCHGTDPHKIKFIQPDGTYGSKSTAASCPSCHQTGIPPENNNNFTQAFKIPVTLRHSSDPSNGSVWGSYWNSSNPKEACIYCHNITLHNILPLGRILEWSPGYIIDGLIGSNLSCAGCHYKGSANYDTMSLSFTTAGLQIPPEITNGSGWNGNTAKYFNHSLESYVDSVCVQCHGNSLSPDARMSEFLHNVDYADMNNCVGCHRPNGAAPEVNVADLGAHVNLNLTGGDGNLTSEDCKTCHFSNPHGGPDLTNTYYCYDCHNKSAGGRAPIRSSKKFDDRRHGELTCINCHVADGTYHQGNPRGAVANPTYVSRYNSTNTITTDCADCHREANLDDAPFNAPGGGTHIGGTSGSCGGGCHTGGGTIIAAFHSIDPLDSATKKPYISTPALDPSTVIQGTEANITVTVNFTNSPAGYGNALVDGAQYRIMSDSNEIRTWTPMTASDGNFDSTLEVASGIIDTNNLSGTYNIEVRGMGGGPSQDNSTRYYPINGDISLVKTVELNVELQGGFINGTITSGGSPLEGALVSATDVNDITKVYNDITIFDGSFSLSVPIGTYDVTASKPPTHNDNTTSNVEVTAQNTTYANMSLSLKPTGNISGVVTD